MTYLALYFIIGIIITFLLTHFTPNDSLSDMGSSGVFLWISFITFLWPLVFMIIISEYFKD